MAQKWHDLLFAHWPASSDVLRKLIPENLELDIFAGQAWISIVPFAMSGVRLRRAPALPGLSSFPELNVRTYVAVGGKPGVWFFSLDAANPVAVEIARRWFHLPYFNSRIKSLAGLDGIAYSAQRTDRRGSGEQLEATYSGYGLSLLCKPGTLEYFLTERYCLYAQKPDGSLLRSEIHHAPWSLREARASFSVNTMVKSLGMEISDSPLVLHFSKLQDVIVWRPEKVPS
jgi:uncharacterized protein YqjF (DUF2071 family)